MPQTVYPPQSPPEGLRERREAEAALVLLRRRFQSPNPPPDLRELRSEIKRFSGALLAFLAFEEGPEEWPVPLIGEVPRIRGRAESLRRERAELRREAARLLRDADLRGAGDSLGYLLLRGRFERIDARLRRHFDEIRDLVLDSYCADIGTGD